MTRNRIVSYIQNKFYFDDDTAREADLEVIANNVIDSDIIPNYPDFLTWPDSKQEVALKAYDAHTYCGWGAGGKPKYSEVCKKFMDEEIEKYEEAIKCEKDLQVYKDIINEICVACGWDLTEDVIIDLASNALYNHWTKHQIITKLEIRSRL